MIKKLFVKGRLVHWDENIKVRLGTGRSETIANETKMNIATNINKRWMLFCIFCDIWIWINRVPDIGVGWAHVPICLGWRQPKIALTTNKADLCWMLYMWIFCIELRSITSASHQFERHSHQRLLWTTFHGQQASRRSRSSVSFSSGHLPQRSSLPVHRFSTTGLLHHTTHTRIAQRSGSWSVVGRDLETRSPTTTISRPTRRRKCLSWLTYLIIGESKQLFPKAISVFFGPFLGKESYNLVCASDKLISIPPNGVGGISAFDKLRVPNSLSAGVLVSGDEMEDDILCIPNILRSLDFDLCCLASEWGERRFRRLICCHLAITIWLWELLSCYVMSVPLKDNSSRPNER